MNTVNSRFKKDLKLQIHLHKAFFLDDWFLDSLHKYFLDQTTLDLRKENWTFLNLEFTVLYNQNGLILQKKLWQNSVHVVVEWPLINTRHNSLSADKVGPNQFSGHV